MVIKKAEFITSAGNVSQMLVHNTTEIAIVGKSNVGKSSFINFLANNGKLAKTSKDPGRTRLINYFLFNDGEFFLVDLPGYGFAKVSKAEKEKWGVIIENYLKNSKALINVFVLLDIRHTPTADDKAMFNYLYFYNIPFTIIATKSDKLSKQACITRKKELAQELRVGIGNIYTVSNSEKLGKEEILKRIDDLLAIAKEPPVVDDDEETEGEFVADDELLVDDEVIKTEE